jgi:diguanylate cyclase (GGDEF)-like protein/PAS domain S-box-containing protein
MAFWLASTPGPVVAHELPPPTATVRDYYFEVISPEEPLAQNLVTALARSSDGFLWVGTQGGLHRFDGYRFVHHDHDPEDAGSLADGFVSAIGVDADGRLVVGGGRGSIQRLGLDGTRFESVGDPGAWPARGHVGGFATTADGALWIASASGIERIGPDGQSAVRLADPGGGFDLVAPRAVIAATGSGVYAASTGGVALIDGADAPPEIIADGLPRVLALHRSRSGQSWAGTMEGLYRIESAGGATRLWPAPGEPAAGTPISGIAETPDGRLWLAVFGAGLAIVDPATGAVERLQHDRMIAGSLPEDGVRHLLMGRAGLLWIGGESRGLVRVDPSGARFTLITDESPGRPYVATNNVRSLWEAPDGGLWIGTDGDGLKRVDLATRRITYFTDGLLSALPDGGGNRDLRVNAIVPMPDGRLWLPTNRGVLELDPASGATRIAWPDARGPAPSDPHARAVLPTDDGHVWLATWASGLVRLRPDDGSQQAWRHDPARIDSLSHDTVVSLYRDRSGILWVGTLGGLDRVDPRTGRVTRMPRASSSATAPAGDVVRSILEAEDGALWFASHGGLSRLPAAQRDADLPAFERWTPRDGLPTNVVYDLLPSGPDHLWLATNRGLVRMDVPRGRFKRFDGDDGLQGLEFNGGAALALRDGRLAFGGHRGLNLFDPNGARPASEPAPLALTRLAIADREIVVPASGGPPPLRLAPSERQLAVGFAVLDFASPHRNAFEYRLEGIDLDWQSLGTRNEVTFSNLPPGDYRLRVRGFDSDGAAAANELEIPFVVAAPWWQTRAARVAAALALLLALGALFYGSQRRLERERAHAAALREREERLRVAIWGSGDEFWDWDMRAGKLFRIGADNLLGMDHEATISGDDWRRLAVHPDDLERVERILAEHVRGEREAFESEHRVRRTDGRYIWVRSRGRIVERDAAGGALRVAGTARDITETRAAERDRRIAEEVIRSMSEAVVVTDLEFRFTSVNPAFTRMTGYAQEEILGLESSILDCDQHNEDFHAALRATASRTGHWSGELWQRRRDGDEFLCWLELSEVTDADGNRTHFVGVLTDITDRKRAEQELRYLANYDTLTGLPNRTLLGERLAHALIRARRNGTRVALFFIDLDRFKHVNDSLGHAAGDRLLKAAATRIQGSIRDVDTVARLGGDEFTVVAEDLTDRSEAERIARKLVDAFHEPLDIDGRTEVVISPSIGISLYPDHGQVPTDLLKFADTAMYRAKDHGRNTFEFYSPALDTQARWRAGMVNQLHKALERGEFSLVYQPKLALATGEVTGVEALLRWNNPELGRVGPATFVPLAEETGLIVPIGEWVLREALAELRRWARAGVGNVSVAVNVSMLQLLRGELAALLRDLLDETGLSPRRVVLELTESMVMANAERSISTLGELKALGVSIAIDDFGTGYSSLSQLKRLPIDTLKIDKAFVGEISVDADDEAITATVITMAHTLGLDVIAEGVETPEQLAYLRERGCDEVQGYLISPPLPGEAMLAFLLEQREHRSRVGRPQA